MINSDQLIDNALWEFVDEQRSVNQTLKEAGRLVPAAGAMAPEFIRKTRLYKKDGSFKPVLVEQAQDDIIETESFKLPIRVFDVDQPQGLYIHFHGGGWTLGSVYEQDSLLWECACQTNMTVVTLGYPLAPESVLPTALAVTAEAVEALMARYSGMNVCLGGESAGANVALNTLLRVSQKPTLAKRIKAISLAFGVYDLSMTPSQRAWGEDFINLSTPYLEWFYQLCLPDFTPEQRRDPLISPMYAELRNLPPALFSVGTLDPLYDDTLFMAMKWFAAENPGILRVYPEAIHGFNGLETQMARTCNTEIYRFLARSIES
ncbi:alpha/beta hydrolase [Pseudomaricurvus alkylphenolicus]|uniref:alpha/beta hydrolase fold domain-containing protein n=1 Tax=Pseudomaricurvus alkylphenolicus TaxID=1306991 RepID=UPI0014238816|nr:alpha/beta hydrolase [Pseudomaricurvus alkylphenolicus]